MIARRHAVFVIAVACGAAAAAQQPARDSTRATTGTGSISGTVFVGRVVQEQVRVALDNESGAERPGPIG